MEVAHAEVRALRVRVLPWIRLICAQTVIARRSCQKYDNDSITILPEWRTITIDRYRGIRARPAKDNIWRSVAVV